MFAIKRRRQLKNPYIKKIGTDMDGRCGLFYGFISLGLVSSLLRGTFASTLAIDSTATLPFRLQSAAQLDLELPGES